MHKDPRRWVSLASRGNGGPLRDGVLRVVDNNVDLRPLLENEQPGSYQVELESECDGQGDRTVQAMVERSEDGTAWLEAPGLKRGPYSAVVTSLSSLSETRWVAWVLLVPENHYAEPEGQFDLAREIVEAWGEGVAEGEREAFIRAYILHLGDAECESSS
jgi:hypothetical protein